jgi:hypothetical protein
MPLAPNKPNANKHNTANVSGAMVDAATRPVRALPQGWGFTYEIAAGHHRLEAMRRLGFKEADLTPARVMGGLSPGPIDP